MTATLDRVTSEATDASDSVPATLPSRGPGLMHKAVPPVGAFVVFLIIWQIVVALLRVPRYLLPAPTDIAGAVVEHAGDLLIALTSTFVSAVVGLAMSIVIGMLVALIMSQSKLLERSIYPYAIVLQTIPMVAIAPLIVIWVGAGAPAVTIISFLISLFPIITNTTAGLTSTDHNLMSMFDLYNATFWQRMLKLKLPFAMPYIMIGLRVSSGLAVIGAIIGEFIAGIGGLRGGLGYVIISAANRLDMPYLFAAALTSSLLGIIIFLAISLISDRFLRHWHESAVPRET